MTLWNCWQQRKDRLGDCHQLSNKCIEYSVRFESHLRAWMKEISDLLQEAEQLRLETDDLGPQVGTIEIIEFCAMSIKRY